MIIGKIRFPNLVEVRVTASRGIFRREFFLERYVDGKFVGASWLKVNDRIFTTVTLDVEKGEK